MYDPNWRQKAINEGKDQNSAEFAEMRRLESQQNQPRSAPSSGGAAPAGYDPNWRQKALDIGDDQNSPKYATMRALEAQMNSGGGGGGGTGATPNLMFNQPTIDLPSIYKRLIDSSNLGGLQADYDKISKDYAAREEAKNRQAAILNDNPFYSEGTRVGRIAKLDKQFQDDTQPLATQQKMILDQIAGKKADIETQLNLEGKQFDIKSNQAQQAISQFNSLLAAGALDNASGEDIAQLTRATGIPSSMLMSAIELSRKKNTPQAPQVQTQFMDYDDGKNQGYALINKETGDIIKTQVIAPSKPKESSSGGGLSSTQQREIAVKAASALKSVDKNKDKLVSLAEYKSALQALIAETGVDQGSGDNILTQQMKALGYGKWRW